MPPSLEKFDAANEAVLEERRRGNPNHMERAGYWRDEIPGFWQGTSKGIAFTGAGFLLCASCIWLVASLLLSNAISYINLGELFLGILGVLLLSVTSFFMIGGVSLIIAVFVVKLFECLQMQTDRLYLAIFVGGLTGLVVTAPFALPTLGQDLLLLSALVVIFISWLGQVGAAIGAFRVLQTHQPDPEATNRLPRFSLRYLIVASVVLGVILGLLKLIDAPLENLVAYCSIWLTGVIVGGLAILAIFHWRLTESIDIQT